MPGNQELQFGVFFEVFRVPFQGAEDLRLEVGTVKNKMNGCQPLGFDEIGAADARFGGVPSRKMKSWGNLSRFRLTCSFKRFVDTP